MHITFLDHSFVAFFVVYIIFLAPSFLLLAQYEVAFGASRGKAVEVASAKATDKSLERTRIDRLCFATVSSLSFELRE